MMARATHPALGPEAHTGTSAGRWPVRPGGRWLVPFLVVLLLAQMAVAMVTTAVQQTPTIDEPVYVGTAAEYLSEHRVRHNPEHPPLGKLVVAAGVALADPHVDPSFTGGQSLLGQRLLYGSGNDPWRLMLWARLPVIALTLLFGLVVFAFARELAGAVAGLAALALYAFSPDVVAHGSLATLDVPAAGFLLTSAWLLWRARRRPRLFLPLAGAALGAALATRMSSLAAVPVLLALAGVSAWHASAGAADRRRALLRAVAGAGVVALVAVALVWATYLAVDPRLRWTPEQRVPVVRGLRGLLVRSLPFPEAYRDGMRVQFRLENQPWQGFLFGRVYTGSLWYYLPAALLVKTPLGLLALWAAGAVVVVALRRLRPAAPYLLAPAAVLLAAAMVGSRDLGTRYAVFLPMFLAVAAGCVVAARWRWAPVVTGALVLFVAVSSLRAYPFYLPYSNEAFGGPARTRLWLHDSNVDWGQDLGRLADRLRERYRGERVWLVYKGSGLPSFYGIDAADPREVPVRAVHGLLVVSDSSAAKATGRLARLIDSSRPVDDVGHSIRIYRR
ncbi:phospholipid carrier-dependent glycosyltransferase [Streptomyces sp. ALI-76-A]|jgi:4-amino-4-deoxy-L-arabinose transferase-like glycosyltransferase|uniref:phospholipid carrier-dependent glycosyltransferase n=1 Tax=Streptomyces sp. ALI-76-A TaxID=3025736 RepID=UPI00256F3974|nr:phospholipid carrier-dependent glycosyltransferase [Streptomyces sp. ALI-76-A]MDL5205594.1 phospholipid carrier-dependent glycosyltransferase [Streptomyces sp. ALI-76-A]